ncbi:MAG: hydroxymethylpyrimidine/phosphomethylpyrimidine kinase [Arcticibacter sp.]
MEYERPIVLSFAGLDPCGGAGLLADIKTIEQHMCLGFGVTTAISCQTEDRFESVRWLSIEEILSQAKPLLEQYKIAAVKIGLIENSQVLGHLLDTLRAAGIHKIVWDPVLSASSGFNFYNHGDLNELLTQLVKISLITPNLQEATRLAKVDDAVDAARALSIYTNVLLKGGHHPTNPGTDHLFVKSRVTTLTPAEQIIHPKHGSGCVLSSSIACILARGESTESACIHAKSYIERVLASTPNLLAYHYV